MNTDIISDAIAPAIEAAHECVARAAMLTDLASSIGPVLAEIARLASIVGSFDGNTSMNEALGPIRCHVAEQLHSHATTFDGGVCENEIFHRLDEAERATRSTEYGVTR
jgi:hypothetical protein